MNIFLGIEMEIEYQFSPLENIYFQSIQRGQLGNSVQHFGLIVLY
jgi:hypothetical protein